MEVFLNIIFNDRWLSMKKKMIIVLLCIIFCLMILPVVNGFSLNTYPYNGTNLEYTDDWPMFHYNHERTGFTLSIAPSTNTTLWIHPDGVMGGTISSPAVVDGKLFIGSGDHNLYCFNADSGEEVWNFSTYASIDCSPAVYKEKVYIGSWDGNIYCIDVNDGGLVWKYQTSGWITTSSPVVFNEKIYIGSTDGRLYCLDADPFDDGVDEGFHDPVGAGYDLIWFYQTWSQIESSPAISEGRVFIISDGLYCLNAFNGRRIWRYQWWTNPPTLTASPRGGGHRWGSWSTPAISNEKVYFLPDNGEILCLNVFNGSKIWSYNTGEWTGSSPAVAYGNVYFGTWYADPFPPFENHGMLYCFNGSKGNHLWNFSTGHFMYISPAVAKEKVYFGSFDNYSYCLNAKDGRLIWRYLTDGWLRSSPAIIENRVYFACFHEITHYENYGCVYAFEES